MIATFKSNTYVNDHFYRQRRTEKQKKTMITVFIYYNALRSKSFTDALYKSIAYMQTRLKLVAGK
ncbi:MAG: hypothetical protein A2X81_18555 [Desulfobacterales bacterium GWB2_56_26]|nr:MAG: hypothetical protein A2X81_18555 [Desulfobacterales bacterium GWB2_56_26]